MKEEMKKNRKDHLRYTDKYKYNDNNKYFWKVMCRI